MNTMRMSLISVLTIGLAATTGHAGVLDTFSGGALHGDWTPDTTTYHDLIEAEALLRSQRTLYEIARLDVVRAWVRLWLASGSEDPVDLFTSAGI